MKKLAIITTHPVQYNAPLFAKLGNSDKIEIKVFYTLGQGRDEIFDRDFGKQIRWDIPLLEDYDYEFLGNTSKDPGLHHFRGIINPGLIDKLHSWDPAAILVYGWNFHSHLKVMRHFKGRVPVYFRGDSTLIDEMGGLNTRIRRAFLKWIYRHVDGAFYVGKNNKEYFLAHGLDEAQLFFAPHAIDNQRFGGDDGIWSESVAWREKLGIRKDDILVLFAGKFEPKKDPVSLLKAFMSLKQPGCRLLMTGNGILEEELRKLAGEDARILFLPFQNQSLMPAIYGMADLFVLPSVGPGETWGLAVNEAMAAGKAILTSDKVGCAVDLVRVGCNGQIFSAGKQDELAASMNSLLASKEALIQMGKESRELINSWSFDAVCRSIENQISTI